MARTVPRGWQELEIKDFLKFTPREVAKPKVKYRSLGIRSHCKGTFVREVENPDKVMMDTLYAVKKDDLIVNITFAWEGAVALVNKGDEGALVSHRFPTYVFDRDVVIPEYFRYLIPSKRFISKLGIISPGGAGRNRVLDRKDFLHLQFVMPPVSEQKKIAGILSTWDRAIETLRMFIGVKTNLKKWLMQRMLVGKLRLSKYKSRSRFKDTDIGRIPSDWDVVAIKDIAKVRGGSGFPEAYQGQKTGKYPFIKVSDVSLPGNEKYITRSNNYVDEKVTQELGLNVFEPNTIVFAKVGAALLLNRRRILTRKTIIDNNMMGATPYFDKINFEYLFQNFLMIDFAKHVQTSALPSINQSLVGDIKIPASGLKEQEQIAAVFSCIDKEISLLTGKYDLLVKQKTSIKQKLLTGKIRVKETKQ